MIRGRLDQDDDGVAGRRAGGSSILFVKSFEINLLVPVFPYVVVFILLVLDLRKLRGDASFHPGWFRVRVHGF